MEAFSFILLVLGLVGLAIWNKHLREMKQIQIRKVLHEERMKALEKDIPVENLSQNGIAKEFIQMNEDSRLLKTDPKKFLLWVRIASLCFGLLLLFGGIGMTTGFYLTDDPQCQEVWPLGFIPTLTGLGLLLFFGICRGYLDKLDN